MNIKTIFLYVFINQSIYIKIFENIKTKINYNIVCKFLKTFYSLKQFFLPLI